MQTKFNSLDRRKFIEKTSLMAFSIGAFGSISWNGRSFEGNAPTTTDILGPFYRPGAPIRSNLIPPGISGKAMHFGGTIFQKDGKTPLSNAMIEVWQSDPNGDYDNTSDDFLYRAALKTTKDGKYQFKTLHPVPYRVSDSLVRPAHIHIRVSSDDHQDLITQVYFKGDPNLEGDPSSASKDSQNRILPVSQNDSNENVVLFDIVLDKSYPLEQAAFKKLTGLYQMEDRSNIEFTMEDDLLMVKVNGQFQEALVYKGNNHFEGGLSMIKADFNLLPDGNVEVSFSNDFRDGDRNSVTGKRFLKY